MTGQYRWEIADEARSAALLEVRDWLRTEGPDLVKPFEHEFGLEEY